MTESVEPTLEDLKTRVDAAHQRLERLSRPAASPELIDSANLLREKERLEESDAAKSALIADYKTYAEKLESVLELALDIQGDLYGIIRSQSAMLRSKR